MAIRKPVNPYAKLFTGYGGASPDVRGGSQESYPNMPGGGGYSAPPPPVQRTNPYQDLINNLMGQQRADFAAQGVADAASRDAAIRRYLVSYGAIPDFAGISPDAQGFLQGAITPEMRALAEKNTAEGTSIKARTDEANRIAMRRIPAQLAARGTLHSGQTGADEATQAMTNKRTVFDQLNELMSGIEGATSQYMESERQRQRALADAQMAAAMQAFGAWGDTDFGYGGSWVDPNAAAQFGTFRPGGRAPAAVRPKASYTPMPPLYDNRYLKTPWQYRPIGPR